MLHNNQLIDRIYIERKDSEVFLWKTSNSIYNFCSMKHTNGSCFVFFIKHSLDALQPFVLIHRNWSKGLSIRVSLPPVPHKFLDDKGFKTMKKQKTKQQFQSTGHQFYHIPNVQGTRYRRAG